MRKHGLDYRLDWTLSGQPFLTAEGELVAAAQAAIKAVTGRDTELSTAGGTSDGRFIAPTGAQVVEVGPVNASIHKIDEAVRVEVPLAANAIEIALDIVPVVPVFELLAQPLGFPPIVEPLPGRLSTPVAGGGFVEIAIQVSRIEIRLERGLEIIAFQRVFFRIAH